MNDQNRFSALEQELMLQINEKLFRRRILTRDIYEQAKIKIVSGQK